MTNDKILRGISVISEHMPKTSKSDYDFAVGHDQLWFGAQDWVTDTLVIQELENMGWFIDEDSWSCFV